MHNNPQNTGLLVTTAVITMAQSKDQIGVVSIEGTFDDIIVMN